MFSREVPSETMQRLIDYIKMARAEGYSDEQIKQILLSEGWSEATLRKVFIESRKR